MPMTKIARQRLTWSLRIVVYAALAGAGFSWVLSEDSALTDLLFGAVMGALTSASVLSFELRFHRRLAKLPLVLNVLVRAGVDAALIVACYALTTILVFGRIVGLGNVTTSLAFAGVLIVAFIFVNNISRMLGQKTLWRILTARYYRPVPERRIFMFLDLASSTTIAERIGDRRFHAFLNDFFFDITPAILESDGEIYQYVGDEVVVTWTMQDGLRDASCLRCFFRIGEAIEARRERYERVYDQVPRFRAGLHCGDVVVGELGDFKKAIAYVGDTVNTTSRIQAECSKRKTPLIVSGDLIRELGDRMKGAFVCRSLGTMVLRGKEREVDLFDVEATTGPDQGRRTASAL